MVNLDWKDGFGFLNKKHCEKTKFFTIFALVVLLYSLWIVSRGQWNYSPEWLALVILAFIGGYAGVLWYKVQNHKPITIKTVVLFWKDK